MPQNLKDILSNLSTDIDQETLLLYLQDQLSQEKKHEFEKKLLENEFAGDAIEGLQQIHDKKQIELLVNMLNQDLKNKIKKKKNRRKKLQIHNEPWIYVAIVIVLLLLIISFMVIYNSKQP